MVHVAPERPPASTDRDSDAIWEATQQFIFNALVMCSLKGRIEIVLSAWGCEGPVAAPHLAITTRLWHHALRCSEVAPSFRRVTIAIQRWQRTAGGDCILDTFQREFGS